MLRVSSRSIVVVHSLHVDLVTFSKERSEQSLSDLANVLLGRANKILINEALNFILGR